MNSTVGTQDTSHPPPGLLSRERIIAKPGFNRWLVPPAGLAIHLCIGMAYGFSVFWLPLSRSVGISQPLACPADYGFFDRAFAGHCDWLVSDLGWMYSLFFFFLGSSAALFGGWVDRVGPRMTGVVATLCWCGGLLISALGVEVHQLWLLWLGGGVIGGTGLGLGYISPVATLIRWFPDRRGMATGMAIAGFGGGAMIGSPLANLMIQNFATPGSVGVAETLVAMAAIYAVFMLGGAFGYRLPPFGWQPDGWSPPAQARSMITAQHVHWQKAHMTPQFWFIWVVLCLNVSAGIGLIGLASPMIQEIFAGSLIGAPEIGFMSLDGEQKKLVATVGAGFAGLFSLFNILGRFGWASLSDRVGRKTTYFIFFTLGIICYVSAPSFGAFGSKALFALVLCLIASMYGGGFATVPAYLADIFGTQFVGAIHGRLLTAWSAAGIIGPQVVNYMRESQIAGGTARAHVYDVMFYVMAGLLAFGWIANFFVKPVADRWFMTGDELQAERQRISGRPVSTLAGAFGIGRGRIDAMTILAWSCVGIPFAWGVYRTLVTAAVLFR